LADKIGSNQNAIYRAENPNYGKQTITTLKKIAAAFDVALVVRFVPFSELVDWVSGTPRTIKGLSTEALNVENFAGEERRDTFYLLTRQGIDHGDSWLTPEVIEAARNSIAAGLYHAALTPLLSFHSDAEAQARGPWNNMTLGVTQKTEQSIGAALTEDETKTIGLMAKQVVVELVAKIPPPKPTADNRQAQRQTINGINPPVDISAQRLAA